MNKQHKRLPLGLAAAAALSLFATSTFATPDPHTYTFNFNTTLDVDSPHGNPLDYLTGGLNGRTSFAGTNGSEEISATVSAWRIEKDGTNTEVSEYLYKWGSGLGVDQADSIYNSSGNDFSYENDPWHGVDNNPNNCSASSSGCVDSWGKRPNYTGEEFLVFDFGETAGEDNLVSLHSFVFGYAREERTGSGRDHHADATVLSGSNVSGLSPLEANPVTSTEAGFELVGHYANVPEANLGSASSVASSAQSVDGGYSRYWAVSTLLTSLLTPNDHFNLHWFDAAKLAQIVVKTAKLPPTGGGPRSEVPVPTTALLFGLGLLILRKAKRDGISPSTM